MYLIALITAIISLMTLKRRWLAFLISLIVFFPVYLINQKPSGVNASINVQALPFTISEAVGAFLIPFFIALFDVHIFKLLNTNFKKESWEKRKTAFKIFDVSKCIAGLLLTILVITTALYDMSNSNERLSGVQNSLIAEKKSKEHERYSDSITRFKTPELDEEASYQDLKNQLKQQIKESFSKNGINIEIPDDLMESYSRCTYEKLKINFPENFANGGFPEMLDPKMKAEIEKLSLECGNTYLVPYMKSEIQKQY